MKKVLTLLAGMAFVATLATSCSKDEASLTSAQATLPEFQTEGNVEDLLASISNTYGHTSAAVDGSTLILSKGNTQALFIRFFSDAAELANHEIKASVYDAEADSTFFLYSNPDNNINKVTYKGMAGNLLDEYKHSDFEDLYQYDEKLITDLAVTESDPARTKALAFIIAYTFAPEMAGVTYPIDLGPKEVMRVRVGRDLMDQAREIAAKCGSPDCFRRDGYIRMGNVWLLWGSCTC